MSAARAMEGSVIHMIKTVVGGNPASLADRDLGLARLAVGLHQDVIASKNPHWPESVMYIPMSCCPVPLVIVTRERRGEGTVCNTVTVRARDLSPTFRSLTTSIMTALRWVPIHPEMNSG